MAGFFIDRPIFAWVHRHHRDDGGGARRLEPTGGTVSAALAPPAVAITGTYPGASAETIEDAVVQVIEQQMSGLDNLLYMSAESDKDGSITVTLNFAQGTDPNVAQVQVQNKLQLALPRLPSGQYSSWASKSRRLPRTSSWLSASSPPTTACGART